MGEGGGGQKEGERDHTIIIVTVLLFLQVLRPAINSAHHSKFGCYADGTS